MNKKTLFFNEKKVFLKIRATTIFSLLAITFLFISCCSLVLSIPLEDFSFSDNETSSSVGMNVSVPIVNYTSGGFQSVVSNEPSGFQPDLSANVNLDNWSMTAASQNVSEGTVTSDSLPAVENQNPIGISTSQPNSQVESQSENPAPALTGQNPGYSRVITTVIIVIVLLAIVLGIIFFLWSRKKKSAILDSATMKEAKSFVSEARKRGYDHPEIRQMFLKEGWNENQIDQIL